jgi:hypothetical protein
MPTTKDETDWAEKIGKPAFEAIAEMVAALQVDYDRLEELRDELRNAFDDEAEQNDPNDDESFAAWIKEAAEDERHTLQEAAEELIDLQEAAGDCESEEDARERIMEDPLSLEVRGVWHAPGEEGEPEEFCLLLGTGGPAVRIIGDVCNGEPDSPRLEVQDWFKPWTEYIPADTDVLQAYCDCFYFGD